MSMVKKIRKSIEPILLRIINLSIKTNSFPKCLKISKVIPIPKSNDFINLNNYRRVNILPPISRIIEKIWASQIEKYLNEKSWLNTIIKVVWKKEEHRMLL